MFPFITQFPLIIRFLHALRKDFFFNYVNMCLTITGYIFYL